MWSEVSLPSLPPPFPVIDTDCLAPSRDLLGDAPGQSHWLVSIFAVDPSAQGHGHGATLLRWINRCADHAGVPVLLETVGPRNERFYEGSGYEVAARVEVKDDDESTTITLSCMLRQPRQTARL
jgi:GNAT superfamily N-acetyltransferase